MLCSSASTQRAVELVACTDDQKVHRETGGVAQILSTSRIAEEIFSCLSVRLQALDTV